MKKQWTALSIFGLAFSCGNDVQELPWEPSTVIYHEANGSRTEVFIEEDCAKLSDELCYDVSQDCGEGEAADVYVNESGEVSEVVCFPKVDKNSTNIKVVEGQDDALKIVEDGIFVLEGDADAPAVTGDVSIDQNGVTLWGESPEDAVVDGNVTVDKNNVLIRGITVTGNVTIEFNNAQLTNCVIEGNLELHANNTTVAGCSVQGNVIVTGNNSAFTSVTAEGSFDNSGENTACEQTEAAGESISCPPLSE